MATNRNWKKTLRKHRQLLLPAACDALTAKMIEQGGFPRLPDWRLCARRYAFRFPRYGREPSRRKVNCCCQHYACSLPVLVDSDDGYGDEKNVTHTVHVYDSLGVAAIFIEDQKSPKRCGHMGGKQVIPAKEFTSKLKAALAARRSKDELFLLARTDAIEPEGIDSALRRAEQYLNAGADGVYFDGVQDENQLRRIGHEFKGEVLATTILERGGKTPWLPPNVMLEYGFSMVLYPVSLLFRQTRAIQRGLADLKAGRPLPERDSVDMLEFEKLVDIAYWKSIEQKAISLPERVRRGVNKLFQKVA